MKHLIVLIGKETLSARLYGIDLRIKNRYKLYDPIDCHPILTRSYVRDLFLKNENAIVITNSPYVLGEINNILYAQDVAKRFPHNAESIKKIIPEDLWIEKCEAFEIVNGEPVDIFDYELNLINDGALDNETSSRINNEFDDISDFEEYDGE